MFYLSVKNKSVMLKSIFPREKLFLSKIIGFLKNSKI